MRDSCHRCSWALVSILFVCLSSYGQGQTEAPPPQVLLDRQAMDRELERLAKICDALQLSNEATICRTWLAPDQRSDQRCLYLPIDMPVENAADQKQVSWCRHFAAARRAHANWLYAEAQRLASEGNETAAFQTLWHVVREDPEHVEARRVLGPLVNAAQLRPRLRTAATTHPEFAWPPRSYSRIQTPHFMVTSHADARQSIEIAQRLEAAHALWSQLFFEQWAKPGHLTAKLSGDNSAWNESRKMEVVILANREDYLETLGDRESNIGVSVGYYNAHAKRSFFYPNEQLEATFFHELTHQLFAESSRIDALADAGSQGGIWILEGIAIYMESLRSHGTYWTVGGIDASRLQTSRYRAVRDGFWPNWNSFATGTIDAWKQDASVAMLYSHAGGITHALMDLTPDKQQSRAAFMAALTATYEGRPTASVALLSQFANDEAEAKLKYQQMLIVNEQQLAEFLGSRVPVKDLVLAGSEFTTGAWQSLAQQSSLNWLDLSFCNCKTIDLKWLPTLTHLERLSVEGTAIDGALLPYAAQLPKLVELDLSGCRVDDVALAALRGHPNLQVLWLTNTAVTDQCLENLAALPQLRSCDITGSQISEAAWQLFQQQHPLESP